MTRWFAVYLLVVAFAVGVECPTAQALQPCEGQNCAIITVGSGSAAPGGTVSIPVEFTQGPADGETGKGIDEIAAIAFTLGIPGTGAAHPLTINCNDNDGDGLPDGISVSSALQQPPGFRVVVENFTCTNRNRCLCPTEAQQTRDDFINIAIYGPKDLPDQGPVDIPVLPSGVLLTAALQVPVSATSGDIPLTVYLEAANPTKPQYGAYYSQGDKAAVDQTADRELDRSKVRAVNGKITVEAACVGDCNGDGMVKVNELITGVNIALGNQQVTECPAFDRDKNGEVRVDELVLAVNKALTGCQGS
jgi:hypothetical protein